MRTSGGNPFRLVGFHDEDKRKLRALYWAAVLSTIGGGIVLLNSKGLGFAFRLFWSLCAIFPWSAFSLFRRRVRSGGAISRFSFKCLLVFCGTVFLFGTTSLFVSSETLMLIADGANTVVFLCWLVWFFSGDWAECISRHRVGNGSSRD